MSLLLLAWLTPASAGACAIDGKPCTVAQLIELARTKTDPTQGPWDLDAIEAAVLRCPKYAEETYNLKNGEKALYPGRILPQTIAPHGATWGIPIDKDPSLEELARGVAVLIPSEKLVEARDGRFHLVMTEALGKSAVPCGSKKDVSRPLSESAKELLPAGWADLPMIGVCTGFLVSPNRLITAKHCADDFPDAVWVFEAVATGTQELSATCYGDENDCSYPEDCTCEGGISFSAADVATDWSVRRSHYDVASVELANPVQRTPLAHRVDPDASTSTPVWSLGHPWGLPMQIAVDGDPAFDGKTNYLHAFQGSSGSPVTSCETGQIVGVLVKGRLDTECSTGEAELIFHDLLGGGESIALADDFWNSLRP